MNIIRIFLIGAFALPVFLIMQPGTRITDSFLGAINSWMPCGVMRSKVKGITTSKERNIKKCHKRN